MMEIMRSKSQAVLADLHKPALLENRPSHYDVPLIIGLMASSPLFQPRADIVGMANSRHDPERSAAERSGKLSHQLLIFLGAV
jgi:hypothetical protein